MKIIILDSLRKKKGMVNLKVNHDAKEINVGSKTNELRVDVKFHFDPILNYVIYASTQTLIRGSTKL